MVEGLRAVLVAPFRDKLSESDKETIDILLEQVFKKELNKELNKEPDEKPDEKRYVVDVFNKANKKSESLAGMSPRQIHFVGYEYDYDQETVIWIIEVTSKDSEPECFRWHPREFTLRVP